MTEFDNLLNRAGNDDCDDVLFLDLLKLTIDNYTTWFHEMFYWANWRV